MFQLVLIAFLLCLAPVHVRSSPLQCPAGKGKTRIKLLDVEKLPGTCLPNSDDFTSQAVFECLQTWKVHYHNCRVVLTPDLHYSSSGLPCRFFSSVGNITGPHTASVQAAVDSESLLAFLQQNPEIAERLNGNNNSEPASSREVAENLSLALQDFFTHHSRRHHHHSRRHTRQLAAKPARGQRRRTHRRSGGGGGGSGHARAGDRAARAGAGGGHIRRHRAAGARRLLLLSAPADDMPGHISTNPAASAVPRSTGPVSPGVGTDAASGSSKVSWKPAGAVGTGSILAPSTDGAGAALTVGLGHLPGGSGSVSDMGQQEDPAAVSRVRDTLRFESSDNCVYTYKIKRSSHFLSDNVEPSLAEKGAVLLAVAALSGAAMMAASIGWFALSRSSAMRQTEIAEALLAQQREEQRTVTAAAIAASAARRSRRSSSRSSTSSSGGAAAPLLDPAEEEGDPAAAPAGEDGPADGEAVAPEAEIVVATDQGTVAAA